MSDMNRAFLGLRYPPRCVSMGLMVVSRTTRGRGARRAVSAGAGVAAGGGPGTGAATVAGAASGTVSGTDWAGVASTVSEEGAVEGAGVVSDGAPGTPYRSSSAAWDHAARANGPAARASASAVSIPGNERTISLRLRCPGEFTKEGRGF